LVIDFVRSLVHVFFCSTSVSYLGISFVISLCYLGVSLGRSLVSYVCLYFFRSFVHYYVCFFMYVFRCFSMYVARSCFLSLVSSLCMSVFLYLLFRYVLVSLVPSSFISLLRYCVLSLDMELFV